MADAQNVAKMLAALTQHDRVRRSPVFYRDERRDTEGKFVFTNFEFGGSFGLTLEGDCHEVEVKPNLELLVTFGMSLEGVCQELNT
jgi:hypothetical protein